MFENTIEEETQQWFGDTSEFYRKRKQIAAIIENLSQEKLTQSSKILPSLKFRVPVTKSDPRQPVWRPQSIDEENVATSDDEGERCMRSHEPRSTSHSLENASEKGKQEPEATSTTALATRQSELLRSVTKEKEPPAELEFIASEVNGDKESRSQNTKDSEEAPRGQDQGQAASNASEEKIRSPEATSTTALASKESKLLKSVTKEKDFIPKEPTAELKFIASEVNGEKQRDEQSRSENTKDSEEAPRGQDQGQAAWRPGVKSHPSEIINKLPTEEKSKFRANFEKLCMFHQQLIFKKMLTSPSQNIQKCIISYIIEKDNICENHQHNKFPSMKSSASFRQKDQKHPQTHTGKKKRRQKCKAEKDDGESRIIGLIQKFRKRHMTRLEVWGYGF